MIDKTLIEERFSASQKSYNAEAVVQRQVAEKLVRILTDYVQDCTLSKQQSFQRVFEIGCGSGLLTHKLLNTFVIEDYIANDIARIDNLCQGVSFLKGDAEQIPYPKGCSLIASSSCIQWFEDVEGFFGRAFSALGKEGLLLLSTFGGQTLREFRALGLPSLDYRDLKELVAMSKPYFTPIVSQSETVEQYFASPKEILRSLKATGVNALSRERWTKARYLDFERGYREHFCSARGCRLTYEPIYLLLKKNQMR